MIRLVVLVACALTLLGAEVRAEVVFDRQEAGGLVRRSASLNPGDTLAVTTFGCGQNGNTADTVVYILEYVGIFPGNGRLITRAWDDDFAGTYCTNVSYTNNTGAAHTYVIVISTFDNASFQSVQYLMTINGNLINTDNTIPVGGVRKAITAGLNDILQTKPLRPIAGDGSGGPNNRGIEDTYLFLINRTIGSTSYFDDDSEVGFHSRFLVEAACPVSGCDVVAGAYNELEQGNLTVWDRRADATHSDGDAIPDDIEQFYGMDIHNSDTDGDGFNDRYELMGYIDSPTGPLGGDAALIFPYQDADPNAQDVFVEVDYMSDAFHSDEPLASLQPDLVGIFDNDSAWTGRRLRPHFEKDQSLGHWDGIAFSDCGSGTGSRVNFYDFKNNVGFFSPQRAPFYHYAIASHQQFTNTSQCPLSGSSGIAELLGNDIIIALGGSQTTTAQRGTYTHETGHNLALRHHGNADDSDNPHPGNYSCMHSSVMNYAYQFIGWGMSPTIPDLRRYGYSRGLCDASTANPGGSCAATCNGNHCVEVGQPSFKGACGTGNGSPPWTSNGSCDCDYNEWTSEINLLWQGTSGDGDGGPAANGTFRLPGGYDTKLMHPYFMGDRQRLTDAHRRIAKAKADFLGSRGATEGIDYRISPENGKLYCTD